MSTKEHKKTLAKVVNFRPLYFCFLAILLGISLARLTFSGDVVFIVVTSIFVVLTSVVLLIYRKWKFLLILLAVFCLGNGLYFICAPRLQVKDYAEPVVVTGRVSDRIKVGEHFQNIVLEDVTINGEKSKNIYLSYQFEENALLECGDRVAFVDSLTREHYYQLGDFNTFAFRNNIGYRASVVYNYCTIVKGGNRYFDENIRLTVKQRLYSAMDEKYAGICYAILFGDKQSLTDDIKSIFTSTGVIHILTVSGLHVGFLTLLIFWILKKCHVNKWVTLFITLFLLFGYNYLCGFPPSMLRASFMSIVLLTARLSGKEYDTLSAIAFAGIAVLVINPLSALDVGFLMSIFCVTSIVLLNDPIMSVFEKVFPKKIAGYLAISISAQLGILPFTASFFQSLNVLSPFANLFIVPIFALMYPLLFLITVVNFILPFISPCLIVFQYILILIEYIATFFTQTSLYIDLGQFKLYVVVLYFLILYSISYFNLFKVVNKLFMVSVLVLGLSCGVFIATRPQVRSGVDVVFTGGYNIVITDTSGERIMLTQTFIPSLYKYPSKFNVDKIHVIAGTSQIWNVSMEELHKYNYNIGLWLDEPYDKEGFLQAQKNITYHLSEFDVTYVYHEDEFLGISVEWDNHKLLYLTSFNLSNAEASKLLNAKYDDYDLVVSRGNEFLFSCFENATFVSFDYISISDYNYQRDGNLHFEIGDTIYCKSLD